MFWILTYLPYILTFHLACLLTFKPVDLDSLCHFAIGIVGGILCGISSDIPTGILSGIPSDTLPIWQAFSTSSGVLYFSGMSSAFICGFGPGPSAVSIWHHICMYAVYCIQVYIYIYIHMAFRFDFDFGSGAPQQS